MAEISPPPWMQGGTYPALNDRQSFAALLGSEGVVDATTGAGDLRVTERGAGANMSVDVTSGRGWVLGDSATFQGYYAVANDATVNLAIAASDATNPRKDIVIADVRDAFYTANDDWVLRVVTGTAEATPSEPALPDTALKLAVVDVAAGASSITNADITDARAQATAGLKLAATVTGLTTFSTTLTNDSASTLDTWEQWGTEEATVADPGRQVAVQASLTGSITSAGGVARRRARVRLEISLDGGVSWSTGSHVFAETNLSVGGIGAMPTPAQHDHSGTPTGQVQVRAQLFEDDGTAGDLTFTSGVIEARMTPVQA